MLLFAEHWIRFDNHVLLVQSVSSQYLQVIKFTKNDAKFITFSNFQLQRLPGRKFHGHVHLAARRIYNFCHFGEFGSWIGRRWCGDRGQIGIRARIHRVRIYSSVLTLFSWHYFNFFGFLYHFSYPDALGNDT